MQTSSSHLQIEPFSRGKKNPELMSLTHWFCAVDKEGGGCFGRGLPCITDTRCVHRRGHCNDPVNGCQPVFSLCMFSQSCFAEVTGKIRFFDAIFFCFLFQYILYNGERERYFHSYNTAQQNTHFILSAPFNIDRRSRVDDFLNTVTFEDLLDFAYRGRPDTKYTVSMITQISLHVFHTGHVLLGSKRKRPGEPQCDVGFEGSVESELAKRTFLECRDYGKYWCVFYAVARGEWLRERNSYLKRKNPLPGQAHPYKRMGKLKRQVQGIFDEFSERHLTPLQKTEFRGCTLDMLPKIEEQFGIRLNIFRKNIRPEDDVHGGLTVGE